MTHIVLCWDIDGTLLSTARAGIFALEDAVAHVIGRAVDLREVETAGLTDPQIVAAVLNIHGIAATREMVQAVLRGYEDRLPECLHRRRGKVMPNVEAVLDATVRRPDVMTLLLTGNTRRGAAAKLAHYGLDRFFRDGAFSDEISDRNRIAACALDKIRVAAGKGFSAESMIVIGDTPHDVACAQAVGARSLAVATGTYSAELLTSHNPWRVVDVLPQPEDFFNLIGIPVWPQ